MLDLNITLVFQLVNFFIALYVLNLLLIRPIREIIRKRKAVMDDMSGESESYEYQAESVKQAVVEEAKRQAEQIVQQARRTAENEGRAMLAEVRAAIADEIVDAAEKVLAEKLTAAEHEKLITNSLNKVVLH